MTTEPTSTIQSMTGFARAEGEVSIDEDCINWVWEIRSLNGKGLDLKCRLPSWLENLEPEVRNVLKEQLSRGSISVGLQMKSTAQHDQIQVNEQALGQVLKAIELVHARMPDATPPSIDGLLSLRGVLSVEEAELSTEDRKTLVDALLENFSEALKALITAREAEGRKIAEVIQNQIGEIGRLTEQASKAAEVMPTAIRERLKAQLQDLKAENLSEERLAQEVSILAVKSDVREELDRLGAHIKSATDLLESGAVIGRRFDFLVQEFNREANTLCSKAQTIELKQTGLSLKAVIDQLREQIQNIE